MYGDQLGELYVDTGALRVKKDTILNVHNYTKTP